MHPNVEGTSVYNHKQAFLAACTETVESVENFCFCTDCQLGLGTVRTPKDCLTAHTMRYFSCTVRTSEELPNSEHNALLFNPALFHKQGRSWPLRCLHWHVFPSLGCLASGGSSAPPISCPCGNSSNTYPTLPAEAAEYPVLLGLPRNTHRRVKIPAPC